MLRRLTALFTALAIASPLCCCLEAGERESSAKAGSCCHQPEAPDPGEHDCDCDSKAQPEIATPTEALAADPIWELLERIDWISATGLADASEVRREIIPMDHGPPGRILPRMLCVSLI